MVEDKIINQDAVAQSVSDNIKYDFFDHFLVKPLDPIRVKKEFSEPVTSKNIAEDKNGVKAVDFDEVKTETKEVDSDFRRGVVIKCPLYYANVEEDSKVKKINIGDIVVFRETAGIWFDIVKDTRLIRMYDILGVVKNDNNN